MWLIRNRRGATALITVLTSSGFCALLIAGLGGYVSLASRPTVIEVRQIVSDLTLDKLNEINHRLAHLDESVDRLAAALAAHSPHGAIDGDPATWPRPRDVAGQH